MPKPALSRNPGATRTNQPRAACSTNVSFGGGGPSSSSSAPSQPAPSPSRRDSIQKISTSFPLLPQKGPLARAQAKARAVATAKTTANLFEASAAVDAPKPWPQPLKKRGSSVRSLLARERERTALLEAQDSYSLLRARSSLSLHLGKRRRRSSSSSSSRRRTQSLSHHRIAPT